MGSGSAAALDLAPGGRFDDGGQPGDLQGDLLQALDRVVPWRGSYEHLEGNSAAHVKASLMGASCSIPVMGRRLRLGTWQGIYLAEFDGPRTRQVWVKVIAG